MSLKIFVLSVFALAALTSCDPEGYKDCAWTLEPEPKLMDTITDLGMIPVCARNREKNKEDCRFESTLEFAKSAWSRKFKYVDIVSDKAKFPRKITNITYCDSK